MVPAPVPTGLRPAAHGAWTALLRRPRDGLVALDYDGTLAPVRSRPQDAVPAPGALPVLHRLGVRLGGLALVTGRPAPALVLLAGLRDVPGLVVLGQYGAERWSAGRVRSDPPAPGLALARSRLPGLLAGTGARLEDKGLSLVVHVRGAPQAGRLLAVLEPGLQELAAAAGLQVHPGRQVLELRPPGRDKGRALRTLSDGRAAVLFAGDDVGDLPAYDAVDVLTVPGIRVCSDSPEAPPELRERADLVVDGPSGVVLLLEMLADALSAGR